MRPENTSKGVAGEYHDRGPMRMEIFPAQAASKTSAASSVGCTRTAKPCVCDHQTVNANGTAA